MASPVRAHITISAGAQVATMPASSQVRIAINDDYELVVAGVAALLSPYADRVDVVELDSNEPTISAVDIILCATFSSARFASNR